MSGELVPLLNGKEIGQLYRDARGRLTLVDADAWRHAADAYPLTLSMPLAAKEHGCSVVEALLLGLLPDNERVLARQKNKI